MIFDKIKIREIVWIIISDASNVVNFSNVNCCKPIDQKNVIIAKIRYVIEIGRVRRSWGFRVFALCFFRR